jgi:hypothetical protein
MEPAGVTGGYLRKKYFTIHPYTGRLVKPFCHFVVRFLAVGSRFTQ